MENQSINNFINVSVRSSLHIRKLTFFPHTAGSLSTRSRHGHMACVGFSFYFAILLGVSSRESNGCVNKDKGTSVL